MGKMVKNDKSMVKKSQMPDKKVKQSKTKKKSEKMVSKKSERREEEVAKRVIKNKLGKTKFRIDLSSFIYKVVKSIAPEFRISSKTLKYCNHLSNTLFERIMQEAENLLEVKGKLMNDQTIKSAVKLVFSGKQLESHALIQIQQTLEK